MRTTGNLACNADVSRTLEEPETPELYVKHNISENRNEEILDQEKFYVPNGQDLEKSSTKMIPKEIKNKIFRSFEIPQNQDKFAVIQKWEGWVTSVKENTFEGELVCIKGEGSDQFAEFSFEDVSVDDQSLIDVGAVFYWSIGYLEKPSGQRLRASLIRFQRLPAWTPMELAQAEIRAKKLEGILFNVK